MAKHTIDELQQWQALPLNIKVLMTKERIRNWVNEYGEDGVYVSFSGGKDSTVLLTIARQMYPKIKAVFVDTGLEYPEIRQFVKTWDNVEWLRPKKTFKQVIQDYGYPFISKEVSGIVGGGQNALELLANEGIDIRDRSQLIKQCKDRLKKQKGEWRRLAQCLGAITKENEIKENMTKEEKGLYSTIPKKYEFFINAPFKISDKCCREMKKNVVHKYMKQTERAQITAQMAEESKLRRSDWLKNGCNAFNKANPTSNPMAFWTEQDVLLYLYINQIPIASVYGDIVIDYEGQGQVEGQMSFRDLGDNWEMFDADRPLLKTTGCKRTGCMFCGYGCHREAPGEGRFEMMKKTHPKQYDYIMRPWEEGGLNYKAVIDWINEHGNLNIRY